MSKMLTISLIFNLTFCNYLLAELPKNNLTNAKKAENSSEKFNDALDEFMSKNYTSAYKLFIKLGNDDSKKYSEEEKGIALYNASLSLENQKKYKEAADSYEKIILKSENKFLFKDTYYRISACCHEFKNWTCVIKNLGRWKMQKPDLNLLEDFEFRVRMGTAYYSLQDYKETVDYLESATKVLIKQRKIIFNEAKESEYGIERISILGLSAFESLAESYKKLAEKISLATPVTQDQDLIFNYLSKRLELKAHYYVKAQDAYIEMLGLGDNETASKGLFLIGQLYENIYNNLYNSEIPTEISEQKLDKEYKENLTKTLLPLILKALTAYKKSAEIASTKKIKNRWIDNSVSAINRLENLDAKVIKK